ncbi:MAG TPA: hypothetical protein V6C85_00380 [Allocoleopsis sp.]
MYSIQLRTAITNVLCVLAEKRSRKFAISDWLNRQLQKRMVRVYW